MDAAQRHAVESVSLNMLYPPAHLLLAEIMNKKEDKIPALLSYSHYLMLSPNAGNYPTVFERFRELFIGKYNYHTNEEKNQISIAIGENEDSNYQMDEMSVNLALGLASADQRFQNAYSGELAEPIEYGHPSWSKYNNGIQISQLGLALQIFYTTLKAEPEEGKESDIWREEYIPFYLKMKEKKLLLLHSKLLEAYSYDKNKKQNFINSHSRQIQAYNEWVRANIQ
jgi:hypothetical protein